MARISISSKQKNKQTNKQTKTKAKAKTNKQTKKKPKTYNLSHIIQLIHSNLKKIFNFVQNTKVFQVFLIYCICGIRVKFESRVLNAKKLSFGDTA